MFSDLNSPDHEVNLVLNVFAWNCVYVFSKMKATNEGKRHETVTLKFIAFP